MIEAPKRSRCRQRGISTVEILVALAVGLFLTAGIIQLFVSSKQTYRSEDAFSRLQDNARYALHTISRDLRMAGNMGCQALGSEDAEFNFIAADAWTPAANMTSAVAASTAAPYIDTFYPVFGYDDGDNNVAPASWDSYVSAHSLTSISRLSGTDSVQVSMASGGGTALSTAMSGAAGALTIADNPDGLGQNSLALVTDCEHTDIFTVTNTPASSGTITLEHATSGSKNHTGTLTTAYQANARVYPFVTRAYFIGQNATTGNPALYVIDGSGGAREIADNVQDMQITYRVEGGTAGEDADVGSLDWNAIVSVRVALLLRSDDNLTAEPRPFMFEDQDANTANDRRLRMAFSSTVALRNKLQ